jgi:predicted metal-dependent enzyme (double-stranded beta helix superfamily)
MCDFHDRHDQPDFGYLVDAPEIRALVEETRRFTSEIADTKQRVEALRPAFGKLLASDDWLPKEYGEPDLKSGMGGGIGQYALYRAEDGSLCLFSLVIPPGSQTPIHDHLAWGLIGVYRGIQDETVYRRTDDGRDESKASLEIARQQTVRNGEFYTLLPPLDDIHYVKTVSDTPSVSIHLLANDTACVTRHRFDAASGIVTPFRSGYSNANCPDKSPNHQSPNIR